MNNIAIYSCDYIGLLSISDSANISEVDRSKLGKEIARMIPVTIPEIVRIRIGCCVINYVPDTELKVNIELSNKDRDYISDLVALRVERNNPFIDLDYAKKMVREHELNHFEDYKRIMTMYLNFLNSVYDGFTCKYDKLEKLEMHLKNISTRAF